MLKLFYTLHVYNCSKTLTICIDIFFVVVDPNYALLLTSSTPDKCNPTNIITDTPLSSTPIIIGVVVGIVGAAMLIGAIVYIFPKLQTMAKLRNSPNVDNDQDIDMPNMVFICECKCMCVGVSICRCESV